MDEMTNAQNLEEQEDIFGNSNLEEENVFENADLEEESNLDIAAEEAGEEEDEVFDMNAGEASELFDQDQLEELNQFREVESFAAKFSEKWVISLPDDPKIVNTIISTHLARKARRT